MQLRSWLFGLKPTPPHKRNKRRQPNGPRRKLTGVQLSLETLDDRSLPSFMAPVSHATSSAPAAVATGDFNSDGKLDLAAVIPGGPSVSVSLGNGDGTFQAAQNFSIGASPSSIAVGDFNGDGKLDLVTANAYDMSVLLGNGDGTFQPATSLAIGSDNPLSVAVGDFNGDGKLDLGVTSHLYVFDGYGYYGNYFHYEGHASVLLGNGDGTFAAPNTTLLSDGDPDALALTDMNGDGHLDMATANWDYSSVSVLLGDGAGNLQTPTDFSVSSSPSAIAAGDLNGDGHADLVTANLYGNDVSVLLGDGNGGISSNQTYATGNGPGELALGDFNHDGHADIVTANNYDNAVSTLLGKGDGAFSPPLKSAAGASPWAIAAGDFNGDGWLDAVTTTSGSNVSILINDKAWPPGDAPSVSINNVSLTEGNTGSTNANFTVSLSAAYSQSITVHYSTADGTATAGSDYTAASGDITFAPGETSKTISIAVLGDRLAEPNENFSVNLSTNDAFIQDGQGIGTILDDEPRISISDVSKYEGNSGTTQFVFTVTLSSAYDQAVTVNYATADGTATVANHDYQAQSGTITFAPGQTTQTITILVNGDTRKESNEWFAVNLSSPSTNALLSDSQGIGWILNDDSGHGKH